MGEKDEEEWRREAGCKDFKLPPIVPYDELIEKFDEHFEIGNGEWIYSTINRVRQKYDVKNKGKATRSTKKGSNNKQTTNEADDEDCGITSTRYSTRGRAITQDEQGFKAPLPTTKVTPKRRNNDNANASADTITSEVKLSTGNSNANIIKSKPTKRQDQLSKKPGTLGSKDEVRQTTSRRPPHLQPANAHSLQHNHEFIDTKNLVNSDMVHSLSEICHRLEIDPVPDDPTSILRKVSLVIPRLNFTDDEIKSVMQTEDIRMMESMVTPDLELSSDEERLDDSNVTKVRSENYLIETVCID